MPPDAPHRTRWAIPVLVALCAMAAGAVVVFATTPNGPGLSVDSASYELAATSYDESTARVAAVLNGVFPPGYPAAIAAAQRLTSTPRDGAVTVNVLCLGATVALVGFGAARARSRRGIDVLAVPVGAAVLLATSAGMLRWTGYVMAEPLSIFLVTAAAVAAAEGLVRPRWLVLAGVAAGAAGIARHGALATVPALALLVPVLLRDWRARVLAATTIAVTGTATWYVGTRLLLGGPPESRRAIAWHPPGLGDLRQLVDTIGAYWLPDRLGTDGIRIVVVLGGAVATLAAGRALWSRAWRDLPPLAVLATSLAVAHVVVLAVSKAWLDQAIVADDRLMLPIVPLLVLAVGASWPSESAGRPAARGAALVVVAIVLLGQVDRSADWVRESRREGIEYGHRRFSDSPTLGAARGLPASTLIWTNDVSLLSLRADRQAFPIPSRTNSYSGQADPGFDDNLAALRRGIEDAGVIVFVDGFTYPQLISREDLLAALPGLVAEPYPDGLILRAG